MKEKVNNQVLFDQVCHASDLSRISDCLGVEPADIARMFSQLDSLHHPAM